MDEIKTEFCVVGSGPAGAILSTMLAEAGRSVVLVEQGGRFTPKDRQDSILDPRKTVADIFTAPGIDKNIHPGANTIIETHGRTFSKEHVGEDFAYIPCFANGVGGGSVHWHGNTMRPTISDMKMRSMFGRGVDWPITYEEVEPWLVRAEEELGVQGNDDNPFASPRSAPFPMPSVPYTYFNREIFGPAARKLGLQPHSNPHAIASQPYRGRPSCIACRFCMRCQSGARYAADQNHIPVFEATASGKLVPNTRLMRLETSKDGKKIVAAHAKRVPSGDDVVITATSYILALGGVETPRMLLLSASRGDHVDGLGNLGGTLGQRFGSSIYSDSVVSLGRKPGYELGYAEMGTDFYRDYKRDERAGFAVNAGAELMTTWLPREFMPVVSDGVLDLEAIRRSSADSCFVHAEGETGSLGTVTLDPEKKDYWGDPVAHVSTRLDEWGMGAADAIQNAAERIADAMGASAISHNPIFIEGAHPWGATPMASTPDEGVCDTNLRVFGLDNLSIVSSSVFPYKGASNPTLIIVALALRLGEHLLRGGNQ